MALKSLWSPRNRIIQRPDMRGLVRNHLSAAPMTENEIDYDQLEISAHWRVHEPNAGDEVRYFMYQLVQQTPGGEPRAFYKAVRFLRLTRVPRYVRQMSATSELDMFASQKKMMAAVREQGVLFVTLVAKSPNLPMVFAYGVQAVGNTPEEAQQHADRSYTVLKFQLGGTYEQLEYKPLRSAEAEELVRYQSEWNHIAAARGRPRPIGADGGVDSQLDGNRTDVENSQNQLDTFLRGMVDKSFMLSMLTIPVTPAEMALQWRNLSSRLSDVRSSQQGVRSINAGMALPLGFSSAEGDASGITHNAGLTDGSAMSEGVSQSHTESFGTNESATLGESQSLSQSEGRSSSQTDGVTDGVSSSQSTSTMQSTTESATTGQSQGVSFSESASESESVSVSESAGQSAAVTESASVGSSEAVSRSTSLGQSSAISESMSLTESASSASSMSRSEGVSEGVSSSQSQGLTSAQTVGESAGVSNSVGESTSATEGRTVTTGQSLSQSQGLTESASATLSTGTSATQSFSEAANASFAEATAQIFGTTSGDSSGVSNSNSASSGIDGSLGFDGLRAGVNNSVTDVTGNSSGESSGLSINSSNGATVSSGLTSTLGESLSNTFTTGESAGLSSSQTATATGNVSEAGSLSLAQSLSQTIGESFGVTQSASLGESLGTANSQTASINSQISTGSTDSYGVGQTAGTSLSNGQSLTQASAASLGQSASQGLSSMSGQSSGVSTGQSAGLSSGVSSGQSSSVSSSQSLGQTTGVGSSESVGQSRAVSSAATKGVSSSTSAGVSNSQSQTAGTSAAVADAIGRSAGASSSAAMSTGYASGWSKNATAGGSAGVIPTFGVSTSKMLYDEGARQAGDVLAAQAERYMAGVEGGAFLYQMFLITPDALTLAGGSSLLKSAFWGPGAPTARTPQPFHVAYSFDDPAEQRRLLTHAAAFTSYQRRERSIELMEPFKFSTYLTQGEIAAMTNPPAVELPGIQVLQDSMPVLNLPFDRQDRDLMFGNIVNGNRAAESNVPWGIDLDEFSHMLIAGSTGSGKTTTLKRLTLEAINSRKSVTHIDPTNPALVSKTEHLSGALIIDWKRDFRNLATAINPERFRFYSVKNPELGAFRFNPLAIPTTKIDPGEWANTMADVFMVSFGLGEFGRSIVYEFIIQLFTANRLQRTLLANEIRDADDRIVLPAVYLEPVDRALLGPGTIFETDGTEVANVFTHPELSRLIGLQELAILVRNEIADLANQRTPAQGFNMRDRLQTVWRRLMVYAPGAALADLVAAEPSLTSEETLRISDLLDPDTGRVSVVEADGLDLVNRKLLLGSLVISTFRYGTAHGDGVFDHGGKGPGQFIIMEEAQELLSPEAEADRSSAAAQTELFSSMFRRARSLGLHLVASVQTPSTLAPDIRSNISAIISHQLTDEKDREVMGGMFNWSNTSIGGHLREIRYLGEMPIGWVVARINARGSYLEAHPVNVVVDAPEIREVTDAELVRLARRHGSV